MAFDTNKLQEKLRVLTSTQQSIETVSMYCQVQKRHAKQVVATWYSEFADATSKRKVALLYLANDVLQNSRKKGPEFVAEFHKAMPKAIKHAVTSPDEKLRSSATRLVDIWEQRRVFGSHAMKPLKEALKGAPPGPSGAPSGTPKVANGQSKPSAAAKGKGTDRQTDELKGVDPILRPLVTAISEAQRAAAKRAQHLKAQRLFPQDFSAIPEAQVGGCLSTLQGLQESTTAEISARTRAITIMHELLRPQQEALKALQASLTTTQSQLQQVTDRAASIAAAAAEAAAAVAASVPSLPPQLAAAGVPQDVQPGDADQTAQLAAQIAEQLAAQGKTADDLLADFGNALQGHNGAGAPAAVPSGGPNTGSPVMPQVDSPAGGPLSPVAPTADSFGEDPIEEDPIEKFLDDTLEFEGGDEEEYDPDDPF